jgi:fructose-1,6-bisphosphatase/inositol monophosphatase family enzyme
MTTPVDLDAVAALIRRVADEHIMPRFRRLSAEDIREKAPGNLVTVADIEAEHALTPALAALLPGSLVVGEEAVAHDPAALDRLNAGAPVWIIDPIDGTLNFAKAVPRFAVMVALVDGAALRAGWIYDPNRPAMAMAMAGNGTWLIEPGRERQRLRIAEPPTLDRMRGSASGRLPERGRIHEIIQRSNRLGTLQWIKCAGHEYLNMVEGRLDYAVFGRTLPWDHAAGVLLHREAGGVAGFLDGRTSVKAPYSPLRHNGPLLLAPSPAIWSSIREVLLTA